MEITEDRIVLRMPDDMHVHLRDEAMLENVVFFTRHFGRGVAMGNLPQAIATGEAVRAYKNRIEAAVKAAGSSFRPLMTIMLVKGTTPEVLKDAVVVGARILKLIPGQTSTNSQDGISLTDLTAYRNVLQAAADLGMTFSCHWELNADPKTGLVIPELQRETMAIPYLQRLINDHPLLNMVVEHMTTEAMVRIVRAAPSNVGATITAHHLILSYDQVVREDDEINTYLYCKPVAKTEADREALWQAIKSADPRIFFGSDSAPHLRAAKKKGAAGIFSAPVALPLLVELFEAHECLGLLEAFVAENGARFYGLPLNQEQICMVKRPWKVPPEHAGIPVFLAEEELAWQVL